MRKLTQLSSRVKKNRGSKLATERYEWLSLENAEPDFGFPTLDDSVIGSDSDGTRKFFNTASTNLAETLVFRDASGDFAANHITAEEITVNTLNVIVSSLDLDQTLTAGNIETEGWLRGPSEFVIDPFPFNDIAGTVVIRGDLVVEGVTTTVNSTTVDVDDININLASGSTSAATSNGGGLTIELGVDGQATILYGSTNDDFTFNKDVVVPNLTTAGSIEASTFTSTVADGTAPFTVTSTTKVTNLNADKLDGFDSGQLLKSDESDNYVFGTLTFDSGTTLTAASGATVNFNNALGTAPFVVVSETKVTNLNADKLDGLDSTQFLRSDDTTNYTFGTLTFEDGTTLTFDSGADINFNNAQGTAPFDVVSTTVVTNLNADKLDGFDEGDFLRSNNNDNYTSGTLTFDSGTALTFDNGATVSFSNDEGTAPFVVTSTTVVTNLNADLLDGNSAEEFTLQFVTDNGATTTNGIQTPSITTTDILPIDNGVDTPTLLIGEIGNVLIGYAETSGAISIGQSNVNNTTETNFYGDLVYRENEIDFKTVNIGFTLADAVTKSTVDFTNADVSNLTVNGLVVSGTFTGDLTGDLTGNADTATTLETARNIAGVSFDGSADIDIPIDNLSNVTVATAGDAHVLFYDTVDSQWKNFAVSGDILIDKTGVATIQPDSVELGTDTTGSYVASASTTGNGLSGSVDEESGVFTVTSNATSANDVSTIVFRDASGNFSAGTITANLTGNADTATALETARNIAGVSFDGTADIAIPIGNLSDVTVSTAGDAHVLFYDTTDSQWKNFAVSGDILIDKAGVATIQADSVELGTDTTGSYVASASTTGNGISGSVDEESGVFTVSSNATELNTASTIVFRDANGDFAAGTITFDDLSDGTITIEGFVDEDDMVSNSATLIPTQQSVKAYVDNQLDSASLEFNGDEGPGTLSIDLNEEVFAIIGTANQIVTAGSGNQIQIGLPDNVTIEQNLTVKGDFTVNGTSVTINTSNLTVSDPIIHLAGGNDTADSVDSGFITHYSQDAGTTILHAGIVRDASDGKFKFFSDLLQTTLDDDPPADAIDFASATISTVVANIEGDLTGNADTATTLETARNIAGVSFDGSADIDIPIDNLSNVTIATAGDGDLLFYDTVDSQWKNFTVSGDVVIGKDGVATIQADSVELGTDTTGSYVASAGTSGNGISGSVDEESGVFTVTSNATSANDVSTIVFRDASGNFSAGTITATLTGNADTATALQTARNIAGVSFDGTADIDIPIENLSNVTIATAGDGHFVIYDTADSQWKNFAVSGDILIDKAGVATIQADSVELGTDTTGSYVASAGTSGNGLSGSVDEESGVFTVTSNAVSTNTVSTLVFRDESGDFSAGTITAALSGNATTATTLETARNIAGVSFDGSADIDIPIENLSNVTIATAGDGHFVIYDTVDSQWKNFAVSGDVVIDKAGVATIQADSVELGTDTTGSYVASAGTSGNGISGSVDQESGVFTVTSNAVSTNTASTIVFRDASGDFSAGTITANLTGDVTGNADTATTLETAREIAGVSFDGSANIDIPIENLSNVTIATAGDGHFVIYDTADSQWKNFAVSGDIVIDKAGVATIQADSVELGTDTTGSYVASAGTSGNGISGSVDEESGVFTVTSNAVSTNTASTLVFRDASGDFSAGTITAALSGNATTATTLETAREIAGVSFDGSADIAIPVQNLSNVTVTTAGDAHLLFYDTADSQWKNSAVSGDVLISKTGVATIQPDSVELGTDTTGSYVASGATSGNGLSGSVNEESGVFTVTSNAVSTNTASTLVFRDASGDFSAGTITSSNLVTEGYLRGPALFVIDPVGFEDGSGVVEVDGTLNVTSNLVIDGNLVVSGTTFTVDATTLNVDSNIIYLNSPKESTITNAVGNGTTVTYTTDEPHQFISGQTVDIIGVTPSSFNIDDVVITGTTSNTITISSSVTDTYVSGGEIRADVTANVDLVVVGAYDDGTYSHGGVFRDASDGVWKFFEGYTPEPYLQPFLDTTHPSFAYANVRGDNIRGNTFTSDIATGTAPFTVTSTTKVTNLNVDAIDGYDSTDLLKSSESDNYTSGTLTFNSGTTLTAANGATVNFNNAQGTAPFVVTSTTKVTNLNADYLDGLTSADFTLDRVTDNGSTTTNNISVGQVTTTGIVVDSNVQLNSATHTATTIAAEVIATFDGTVYSSAKFVIQAKDTNGDVQVSEVLIAHDTVTSILSEYSIVHTSTNPIATYTTDINTGNVRLLAAASTTNTDFTVSMTLLA